MKYDLVCHCILSHVATKYKLGCLSAGNQQIYFGSAGPRRVAGLHGFGSECVFSPVVHFGFRSGLQFEFRAWVRGHCTDSNPPPLPTLLTRAGKRAPGRSLERWSPKGQGRSDSGVDSRARAIRSCLSLKPKTNPSAVSKAQQPGAVVPMASPSRPSSRAI